MSRERKLISFDWAMKRLLRSKANFAVLEGFLSELLKRDVTIEQVLESESNKDGAGDKLNRVDLLVNDRERGLVIIEVQYESELDYFQRMLFGVSRTISENLKEGRPYGEMRPVISVNILYFNLGGGTDYVYTGTTTFRGMHDGDELVLNEAQKSQFHTDIPAKLFPIYYLLKINNFDDVAKDGLDEWIYFLKNEKLPPGGKAKGLREAERALDIMKLSAAERRAYEEYQAAQHYKASMVEYTVKQLDEERRQKEEALRGKDDERRQKEEALLQRDSVTVAALKALMARGLSEREARKALGL
jgi:predicted transposase/invertase (TIGR01784 family)